MSSNYLPALKTNARTARAGYINNIITLQCTILYYCGGPRIVEGFLVKKALIILK